MEDDEKKTPTFEDVAEAILDNVQEDRKSLLEVIDAMKKVAEDVPETSLVFCEQIVKAHDVLNKQTAQAASLAALLLKEKLKHDEAKPEDNLWDGLEDPFAAKEH